MYGRVTKYFHDRGFGFICGEDRNTYFIHHSKLCGEYIEKGYYVYFKPFQNDRSDYNAKGIVIVEIPEKDVLSKKKVKKSKKHRKNKTCNADQVIKDDKPFKKFAKKFLSGQKKDHEKAL